MDEIPRKSAREEELDHLFAEEFACDPGFASRYLAACGIDGEIAVDLVVSQPSLSGAGFGDLLVEGRLTSDLCRPISLLIEHKIDAQAAHRQAERYNAHADRLRRDHDFDLEVVTILAAPASYRGERDQYDASIDLETAAELIQSDNPNRQAWRRDIVGRALAKKAATGVRAPDLQLHAMRSDYLDFMRRAVASSPDLDISFPDLRPSYYDGDSWVSGIQVGKLPKHITVRHRLWTSARDQTGMIDLIVTPASVDEKEELAGKAPAWAEVAPYGVDKTTPGLEHAKGIQIMARVPEMRQAAGFSQEIGEVCLQRMISLADWYADTMR